MTFLSLLVLLIIVLAYKKTASVKDLEQMEAGDKAIDRIARRWNST